MILTYRKQKIKRMILMMCISALMFTGMSESAYAYDHTDYEITDDLFWVVDKNAIKEPDTMVIMYMLVQPTDDYMKGRYPYSFYCLDGIFDYGDGYIESSGCLQYWYWPQNKMVIEQTDHGEIWMWQFGIEYGTYEFSVSNGDGKFYTLSSSLGSPFVDTDEAYESYKDVVIVDETEDSILIYTLCGDYQWATLSWYMYIFIFRLRTIRMSLHLKERLIFLKMKWKC